MMPLIKRYNDLLFLNASKIILWYLYLKLKNPVINNNNIKIVDVLINKILLFLFY